MDPHRIQTLLRYLRDSWIVIKARQDLVDQTRQQGLDANDDVEWTRLQTLGLATLDELADDKWPCYCVPGTICPQQDNVYDCGVFTCAVELLIESRSFSIYDTFLTNAISTQYAQMYLQNIPLNLWKRFGVSQNNIKDS